MWECPYWPILAPEVVAMGHPPCICVLTPSLQSILVIQSIIYAYLAYLEEIKKFFSRMVKLLIFEHFSTFARVESLVGAP